MWADMMDDQNLQYLIPEAAEALTQRRIGLLGEKGRSSLGTGKNSWETASSFIILCYLFSLLLITVVSEVMLSPHSWHW